MNTHLAPYSIHPSFEHWSVMLASLKERTGKDIHEWAAELQREKSKNPAECKAYLKARNVGAAAIGLVLDHMAGKSPENYDPHAMVADLFKGPKAGLMPLYEKVLQFGLKLGDDVKACPCATMVPLYRQHVFAQLKPSTKTRLDLGLALGNLKASKAAALIDTGGLAKKDRITHRLELNTLADFNDFAKDWLRRAYESDSR